MRFDAYAAACIPETYTVLGLRLRPLSLGHYLLMTRFGCAYASDTETTLDIADLITGVLICSMTYEECNEFFRLPRIKFFSWENLKTFGQAWYYSKILGTSGYEIRMWGKQIERQSKKSKTFNILSEAKRFQKYITESSQMPAYFEGENTSDKESGAHWSIGLHSFLLTKYSETEAMNLSIRQAFAEYCKFGEEQGSIEFLQPHEEAMIGV